MDKISVGIQTDVFIEKKTVLEQKTVAIQTDGPEVHLFPPSPAKFIESNSVNINLNMKKEMSELERIEYVFPIMLYRRSTNFPIQLYFSDDFMQ